MYRKILQAIQKRFLSVWFLIIIVLVILPASFSMETPLQFTVTAFLFICLLLLFWIPEGWLTTIRASVAVFFLGSLSLLKGLLIGGEAYGFMLPLAVFMGGRMKDKAGVIFAFFFGVCTSVLIWLNHDLHDLHGRGLVSFIITYIGCFIGSRGFRIQEEANRINQLHLEELRQAHKELQLAHEEIQIAAVNAMHVAVLEERNRIARDLHDALGHSLTSLIVQLHALQYMLNGGNAQAEKAVKDMLDVAKQSLKEIRNSIHTLAIDDQSSIGLNPIRAFLSQTANHTGLSVQFQAAEEIHLDKETMIVFYRILQEAVTNTLRHSDATRMHVSVERTGDHLAMSIWDNGKIAPNDSFTPGFGLKGMQERVKQLQGSLTFHIREPHGFQIDLKVPYKS